MFAKWGYGATVARLTPDQKVGSSDLSALNFSLPHKRLNVHNCRARNCMQANADTGSTDDRLTVASRQPARRGATQPALPYTWPGSNWRLSACEAAVIAIKPQVLGGAVRD